MRLKNGDYVTAQSLEEEGTPSTPLEGELTIWTIPASEFAPAFNVYWVDSQQADFNTIKKADTITAASNIIKAAGIAVVANDTGRVLLLQRALADSDPASGKWEFPGGHLEENETPLDAAQREWAEETGTLVPEGAMTDSVDNGVYRLFVLHISRESDLEINLNADERKVLNPDDPDQDNIEVLAWWSPEDLKGNPALRDEAHDIDWTKLQSPFLNVNAYGLENWPEKEREEVLYRVSNLQIKYGIEVTLDARPSQGAEVPFKDRHYNNAEERNAVAGVLPGETIIHINPKAVDPNWITKQLSSTDLLANTLNEAIIHEFGHVLEHTIDPEQLVKLYNQTEKEGQRVSEYANKDIHEDVAESFLAHTKGEPTPWNSYADYLRHKATEQFARGNPEALISYWRDGEGADRINWGTPCDFTRCMLLVGKYLPEDAGGFCQNRHMEIYGESNAARDKKMGTKGNCKGTTRPEKPKSKE